MSSGRLMVGLRPWRSRLPPSRRVKPKARPKLRAAPPEPVATTAAAPAQDSVAQALGEVAMILNNIEVRGWRPPGGGRGTPPPGVPTDGRGGPGGPGSPAGPGSNDRGLRGEGDRRSNAPGGAAIAALASGTAIRACPRSRGCARSGSSRTPITRGTAEGSRPRRFRLRRFRLQRRRTLPAVFRRIPR